MMNFNDLPTTWFETTSDRSIVIHMDGRPPVKVPGFIGLWGLMMHVYRLASPGPPVPVLPVTRGRNLTASSFRSFMPRAGRSRSPLDGGKGMSEEDPGGYDQ